MPMFTQKHYVAIARVIHARRVAIKADPGAPMDSSMAWAHQTATAQELETINDLVVDLVKLFEQDNPKFRSLIFIEECNKDLR